MTDEPVKSTDKAEMLRMVTDIVASYVSNAKVAPEALPELIGSVYATLSRPAGVVVKAQEPAVPIRKSVTPDYVICLEDGKKLKMMKRYLMTAYGMTPEQYRQKWGLPADYPMVAPNYARHRSSLAKESGLGLRRGARTGRGGTRSRS
jgi:predicted transcriptional regulator